MSSATPGNIDTDSTRTSQLPLTIGIYGRWGSGKTSLMKMVEKSLTGDSPEFEANEEEKTELQHRVTGLKWVQAVEGQD